MKQIGKLKGALFMFNVGNEYFFFKKNVYFKAKKHKTGLFRPIDKIAKSEILKDYSNIYKQYISNEKTLYNMVEWKILQVRKEDSEEFEELRSKLGVEKYKLFKLMLENYKFNVEVENV